MTTALGGTVIVDATTSFWASLGVALLADFGARTVRLELLPESRERRLPTAGGDAPWDYEFALANRNKQSLALDTAKPEGRRVFEDLIRHADVFVTDRPRGELAERGWGYDTLSALKPDIIYTRASGCGPQGPDADAPALDELAAARTGMMPILPQPGQPPIYTGGGQMYTAAMLALGTALALRHRKRTGEGQEVDVSLFAGNMYGGSLDIQAYLAILGERFLQPISRLDAGNPMSGPMYPTSDGRWVTLTMPDTDRYWPVFAEVVGIDAADSRFDSHEKRCEANRLELMQLLEKAFAREPAAHWKRAIVERGLNGDVIEDYSYPANDPQAALNSYVIEVDQAGVGAVKMLGFPLFMSETPAEMRSPAPTLGEHSIEVLREVLSYGDERTEALQREGVLG
jgi:crotonobetainyl-CoA:carnitine CoA-transferase CaiB-like acyl-CoA transferase